MTLIVELHDKRKEAALKARAEARGLSAERYVQQIVDRELDEGGGDEDSGASDRRPIWEVINDRMTNVPDEVFSRLPEDGASQVDHYIYGLPKRD